MARVLSLMVRGKKCKNVHERYRPWLRKIENCWHLRNIIFLSRGRISNADPQKRKKKGKHRIYKEHKTTNYKSRNTEREIPNTKHRIRNTKHGTWKVEHKTQITNHKWQSQNHSINVFLGNHYFTISSTSFGKLVDTLKLSGHCDIRNSISTRCFNFIVYPFTSIEREYVCVRWQRHLSFDHFRSHGDEVNIRKRYIKR